jgi:leucyl-tRNA synthetase
LDEDADDELAITVFTTRPDTLYGATYMVLAPEHPMVDRITPPSRRETVEAYRLQVAAKSERDRMADTKDKTGVFIGAHAINPVNGEKIPIYIADYVLMGYGTGAIMAVPAHDQRDYDFAKKFDIPIRQVVRNPIWNAYPDFATLVEGDTIRRRFATATLVSAQDSTSLQGALEVSKVDPSHFELCNLNDGRHAILLTTGYDLSPVFSSSRIRVLGAQSLNAAFEGEGIAINSPIIDGMPTAQAKEHIIETLEREGNGVKSVKYKLRDWLFSRQRYWGEPFPIALDEQYNTYAIDEAELPLTLPELEDFKPTGTPEPPLSKAKDWLKYEREGKPLTRETNTMPQWAGSCWYYLRYIDPKNPDRFIDPAKEKYWMPVDLYVGGVEHAVLHLLYSRFWHKVLFDLGHVSTPEPFQRLVNQGLILGEVEYHFFESADGKPISASEMTEIDEENTPEFGVRLFGIQKSTGQRIYGKRIDEILVEKKGDGYFLKANPAIRVDARSFKMSKSRGNVMNPDDIVRDYGADCFRLYEMYMGPLEAQKPWNTRDIVGMMRFLNSVWRNLVGDEEHKKVVTITSNPIPEALDRMMHRAIKKVADDISGLRFNTAIAELIKLNNEITGMNEVPRELAENLVLMLAPFAPHMCEELWERLGHHKSLARRPWPSFDASKLIESTMELPVQVNGKLRDKITVDANADENTILDTALAAERVKPWVEGKTIKKKVYVPKKLVNFVVA